MDYPFRFQPYKHQAAEFQVSKDLEARALLWQMRTGKTKLCIDTACYRYSIRQDLDGVLILAPNGVHSNWVRREIPVHVWLTCDVRTHAWETRASRENDLGHRQSLDAVLRHKGLSFLAINSEALSNPRAQKAINAFLKRGRIMLIVDESHDFRTPGSRRTKLARGLAKKCCIRRILTGTAVSNSPLAAFSQFELLHPGALGFTTFDQFKQYFSQWKLTSTRGGRQYPVLDKYINQEELRRRIGQWSSVVLREDCDDLPALMPIEVTVDLPDVLSDFYKKLKDEFVIELEGMDTIPVLEGAVRMTKLQQVLSGWVIDKAGEVHNLVSDDDNPRLNALSEQVGGTDGKLIVWCQFREDLKKVCKRLERDKVGHVQYHGQIHSQKARQEAIDRFMTDPTIKVFVGQPKAGGAGLNLSAAEVILWYSHTFDLITRDQANERATLVGGKSIALVDLVTPRSTDGYMLEDHAQKRDRSEFVAGKGLKEHLLAILREMDP